MVDRERGGDAAPTGAAPERERLATMDPGDGSRGGVVGGGDADGAQPAGGDVGRDSGQGAVGRGAEVAVQKGSQGGGVDHASDGGAGRRRAAGDETQGPAQHERADRDGVGAEDLVDGDPSPEGDKLLGGGADRSGVDREVGGVDRAGRHAGEDIGSELRKGPHEAAQKTGLVSGAGATAAEDQGELFVVRLHRRRNHRPTPRCVGGGSRLANSNARGRPRAASPPRSRCRGLVRAPACDGARMSGAQAKPACARERQRRRRSFRSSRASNSALRPSGAPSFCQNRPPRSRTCGQNKAGEVATYIRMSECIVMVSFFSRPSSARDAGSFIACPAPARHQAPPVPAVHAGLGLSGGSIPGLAPDAPHALLCSAYRFDSRFF